MPQLSPDIEQAIDKALAQAKDELIQLYSHGLIGKVELHCGKKQIRVKALPEKVYDAVEFATE